jgi:hypothetical protein
MRTGRQERPKNTRNDTQSWSHNTQRSESNVGARINPLTNPLRADSPNRQLGFSPTPFRTPWLEIPPSDVGRQATDRSSPQTSPSS